MAFESFVAINQLNGMARETRHKKLALHVHQVLHAHTPAGSKALDFLKCVLRDSAVNLNAAKGKNREDRRIRWTTYKNLLLWFDNWERDLVELGFAYYDPITNKVCIPREQLINILNFDETCMSMDGSTQNRGGRPEVILYDPRFPQVGKATCKKSSLTSTMITLGYGGGVIEVSTRDWNLMLNSSSSFTGGQKHTHRQQCFWRSYPSSPPISK